jgi:WD40 repeat protein
MVRVFVLSRGMIDPVPGGRLNAKFLVLLAIAVMLPTMPVRAARPDIVWTGPGHIGVSAVAVSPNGQVLATAGSDSDGTVKLWNRADGTLIRTLAGNVGSIKSIVFTADGQYMVTGGAWVPGSGDPIIKLRRVSDGAVIRSYDGHLTDVTSVAISPDGTKLASASFDQTAIIWDFNSAAMLHTLSGHDGFVNSVAFSPDGTQVATGSNDNTAKTWSVASGTELHTFTGHTFFVSGAQFTADGSQLITSGWDGTIRRWNAATGSLTQTVNTNPDNESAYALDLTSDLGAPGLVAAGLSNNVVRIWNTSNLSFVREITGHTSSVFAVTFAPGDAIVMSGGSDSTARLSAVADGSLERVLGNHSAQVNSVAFSPNGAWVASCADDLTVRLWKAVDGDPLRMLNGHTEPVNDVAFSPDSGILASCAGVIGAINSDNTIRFWNPNDGSLIRVLTGHNRGTASVAFAPDGIQLASGGVDRTGTPTVNRSTVKIWDVATGSLIRTCTTGPSGSFFHRVDYSPDNLLVAAGGSEGLVKLFNPADGSIVRSMNHGAEIMDVAFSHEGSLVASVGLTDAMVKVWKVADGTLVRAIPSSPNNAQSVVFSADDSSVFAGSGYDRLVNLFRISDGALLVNFDEETGWGIEPRLPLAISPTGEQFGYGRTDATIVVANVPECIGLLRGDANCDSVRSLADVNPFVLGLIDLAAYQAAFPNCDPSCSLDMNNDEVFDGRDVRGFVACLAGGSCP